MNEIIREYTMRGLTVQRNVLLSLVFFLLLLGLVLGSLLFGKNERVIVVPAILEKEFWIEGSFVSNTYLEQMGCFVGDLLLTRSPYSADLQLTILMRHVDPSFASILSRKLFSELEKLKKDKASYVFYRTGIVTDSQNQSVVLEGDRTLFLGDKVLSTSRESYRLKFTNFGGRLLLASIERGDDSK